MTATLAPRAGTRLMHRLLDRGDSWGHLTTTVSRYGSASSTLVVYPPGTPADERRLLRLAEALPVLGLALLGGFAVLALLGADAIPLAITAAALYIAGVVLLAQRTARTRQGSARVTVTASLLVSGTGDTDDFDSLAAVAAALRRADDRLRNGHFSPLEHEMVWSAAHQAVTTLDLSSRRAHWATRR
ncbi:DUF6611 family protein [Rathayibacter sp. VKM Ac-2760]|uniref:DUF6611 family protein n=1 Tax=Rathayibacter sp. VKM Ac-2760 TaxID=2609253 RepID=UPI00131975F9|nr:DUF6611 family protein [Rathayibacter sp. VKM Ac-2760]QHC58639.1 hypothetical protein GSU72_08815 [Rathayibacter sp. VKM Ac-2760]